MDDSFGLGLIKPNPTGEGKIGKAQHALHLELLACSCAIKNGWGMTDLIVESEPQVLVSAITSNEYDLVALP